jgi:dTDP-4-dehydrorhamnose 3,5-epimerase
VIVVPTAIEGVYLIDPEPVPDERGFFARTWCRQEARRAGIDVDWVQFSVSRNTRRGTLRGMHWQRAPHSEAKLVRCTRGRVFDVVVDMRLQSSTYARHVSVELDAEGAWALYIPAAEIAHGFMTLEDDTEVFYHMSEFMVPDAVAAARWDDPAFGIRWPEAPTVMSQRDRTHPYLQGHGRG